MKFKFLIIFSIAALGFASASAPGNNFSAANAAYETGDFTRAVESWESLIAQGEWSAEGFYNLGNSYFRSGEPGLAVLNYRRALYLNPHFPEAKLNLEVALQGTRGIAEPRHWSSAFFGGLSADQFAVLASLLGWTAVACFAIWGFFRHKLKLLMAGLIVLPVFAFCLSGVFFSPLRMPDAQAAIVVREGVAARFAPAESATLVSALPLGSSLKVLSEAGAWTYVELPDARRGWIEAKGIERLIPNRHVALHQEKDEPLDYDQRGS